MTVTLPDRSVLTLPAEVMLEAKTNLTETFNRSQRNNALVAAAVLKCAVKAFLGLEASFNTYFSKGDDLTLISNLNKCIQELTDANNPQASKPVHFFSCLVTKEDSWITDSRELFEHCIKVIREFLPLLQGRKHEVSVLERLQQNVSWAGWRQQAEQIEACNIILGDFLKSLQKNSETNSVELDSKLSFKVNTDFETVLKEVECFQSVVKYIVSCYRLENHFQAKTIAECYLASKIEFYIPEKIPEVKVIKSVKPK